MNGLVGFLTENCRGRGASEQRRPPVLKRTSQRRSQGSARSRVAGQGIDKMSRKTLAAAAMVALVGHAAWARCLSECPPTPCRWAYHFG